MHYTKSLWTLLFCMLAPSYHMHAEFSFKSWFYRNKADTFNKEFVFSPQGTVTIENIQGPILVKTWNSDKVAITAIIEAKEEDLPLIKIDTLIQSDQALIKTKYPDQSKLKAIVRYTLMIPETCKLKAITQQGDIKIKQVKGSIVAETAGLIDIQEAESSINAVTTYGQIHAHYKRLPLNSMVALSSTSGSINLTLPSATHAYLQADTEHGTITTEQEITLKPRTIRLDNQAWKLFKREVRATIGNGGSKIKIISKSGNIKLLEY